MSVYLYCGAYFVKFHCLFLVRLNTHGQGKAFCHAGQVEVGRGLLHPCRSCCPGCFPVKTRGGTSPMFLQGGAARGSDGSLVARGAVTGLLQ